MPPRREKRSTGAGHPPSLPLDRSIGYQVRLTHRLLQRALQLRIQPHGVSLGMWYYLRTLWDEDGLTQGDLSRRLGTMEPTTLAAIASMEREGLVRRERSLEDRRKVHVFLTDKAKDLEPQLLPLAIQVGRVATRALSESERDRLIGMLESMQEELQADLGASVGPGESEDIPEP